MLFRSVFIDEFQDTDDAQISAFIEMQKKLGFLFFIVGDLKQSSRRLNRLPLGPRSTGFQGRQPDPRPRLTDFSVGPADGRHG